MNLNELLHELRTNMLRDVSDAVSADEDDLLWTDPSLVRYLNDGYFRFCRLTEYIQDATTPAVVEIALQTGVVDYPMHPSVLRVMSAQLGNMTIPVSSYDTYAGTQEDTAALTRHIVSDKTGLYGVIPDYGIGSLRTIGVPGDDEDGKTLRLRVRRYPINKLDLNAPEAELELPEHMHLDIAEWAAFRAYRNHDADAEAGAKASAHSTRFQRAVDEAKAELKVREFSRINYAPSWRFD